MLDANVMMYGIAALFVSTPFFCIDIYRIVIVINERVRHGLLLWACQFFGDIVVYVLGFQHIIGRPLLTIKLHADHRAKGDLKAHSAFIDFSTSA